MRNARLVECKGECWLVGVGAGLRNYSWPDAFRIVG